MIPFRKHGDLDSKRFSTTNLVCYPRMATIEKKQMSYGVKFLHLNRTLNFDKSFNLVNRFNFDFGKRWRSMYLFVGASLNYFLYKPQDDYKIKSIKISTGEIFKLSSDLWPGYSFGIQF